MLPTEAMEDACLFLVMLSFILPSPVTFTVNGLPGANEKVQKKQILVQRSSPPTPLFPHSAKL